MAISINRPPFGTDDIINASEENALFVSGTTSADVTVGNTVHVFFNGIELLTTVQANHTWSVSVPIGDVPPDGTNYELDAQVRTGAGNTGGFNFDGLSFDVDTTADANGDLAVSFADHLVNNSEKTSVSYTVAGVDADATATVTFTGLDSNSNPLTASGNGAVGTHTIDLSAFKDGTVSVSISADDTAGNHTPGHGDTTTLDTTADAGGDLAISFADHLVNNSEKTAVSYTVAGVDPDATATVTFSGLDIAGNPLTVNGDGTPGTHTIDLTAFKDGSISASISAADTAGNNASGQGDTTTLDTTADAGTQASLVIGTPGGADKYVVDTHSVSFTIAGLDADAHGTVTFHDGIHADVHVTIPVNGSGAYNNVDLSSLSGQISSSLSITDTAGNTAGATGNSVYSTIQSAVDAALAGQTIGVAAGTYAGATISKALTIAGAGSGATIIDTAYATNGLQLTGDIDSTAGGNATVTIEGIGFLHNQIGVNVSSTTILHQLTVQDSDFQHNKTNGLGMGSGAPTLANVSLLDSTFTQNGDGTFNGDGDISLFGFLGNALLQDVTVHGGDNATPTNANADIAIQVNGRDPTSYDVTHAIGNVTLDNVDVTGSYAKVMVYVQGYTNLDGLNFAAGGTTINGHAGWGYALYIDPMADESPSATAGTPGEPGFFDSSAAGTLAPDTIDLTHVTVSNDYPAVGHLDTVVNGTPVSDHLTVGDPGSEVFSGRGGIDTISGYGAGYHLAISGGHWIVTDGVHTDTLAGVERVVIGATTYELVDKLGADIGGFQSVQAAIDAAAGGETILIAPGTYTESAIPTEASATPGGLYVDKPDLTLRGVKSDGSLITSAAAAQIDGATIISGSQSDFGSNHFVGVAATNTVIEGLHLQSGPDTNNKLLEIWANNVTVANNFIDVNIGGTDYSFATAVYFNDNGTTASDTITAYTVDHNILNEGIIVSNGVGDPAGGIGANQKITNNAFVGHFDSNTGEGRYDTVVINGQVSGIGWLLEPTQTPTISGNTFGDNSTPFLLRGSDNDAANLPSAAEVQTILANNGDANTTYAYAVDSTDGHLITATRNDGSGPYHSFAVTNSIDTLNLALDTTPDNVFGGQRDYIHNGDTIIVQSGATGSVDSQLMADDLKIKATANSADLDLTLATQYADGSNIPGGGVHNVSLLDYSAGNGANVDVTGNALANTIVGNSGNNTLDGSGGDDSLTGGGGNDTLIGGAGTDTTNYTTTLSAASFSYDDGTNKWTVTTGGSEGTDTLSGMEKVSDGSHHFLLVDPHGSYTTIQAAVDAASAGDIILVAPGTYSDFVDVNKAVTIEGLENVGIPGNSGGRGAESVLTGGVRISHDGVTLDGLKIAGTYGSQLQDGTDFDNGVLIDGNNAIIQNSILDGTGLGDVRPFSTFGGGISGLDFNHNQVGNWGEGAYIVESSSGAIDYSDFHNNGNDILTESVSVIVSNSTFENSGGSHVLALPFAQNVDVSSYILGSNVFGNDHPRPVTIYPNDQVNEAVSITGTAFGDTFRARDNNGDHGLSNGPFNLSGGGGDDVYFVSSGDTVVEGSGGGTDEVRTTTSFTLSANVENLTLLDGAATTQTFDDMALGPITNLENGWRFLSDPSSRDESIVAGPNGTHEFKMSSDPSVPDFAGPYSPALDASAGEPDTGAAYNSQTISYEFQAVNPSPDGSRLEVDFGNAAGTDRNNFLVIESFGSGIRIAVSEPDLSGNFSGDGSSAPPNDWRELASGVDPTVAHTLQMRLTYVDGQNNDVIGIYLDGKYIGQTTTFENYHDGAVVSDATHIANAAANLTDRVFFRPSANGATNDGPGGVDAGFYFDNLTNSVYNGNNNTDGTGNGDANVITGNDGDNTLTGLGGDDTLIGGYGVDTAHYNGTLTTANFSFDSGTNQWTVNATGIGEGTDHLSGIEVVTDGASHKFLLLNGGSEFRTTQQAFDSDANAGHTGIIMDGSADVPPATTVSVDGTGDHVINNSESFHVSYTVAGLDPDATATLTFSDGSHPNVVVAVSANGTFNNANLSTLSGTVQSSLHITDSAGNTANVSGNDVTLDTTADAAPTATVTINDGDGHINASEAGSVSYTVAGVDGDATATVTFSDTHGHHVVLPDLHDGTANANLSGLDDGAITASIGLQDTHGNIATGTGDSSTKDTTADASPLATVTFNDVDGFVNASETPIASYTVAGVDGDASATVTFSDGAGGHTIVVSGLHDGVTSVDLTGLNDGPISASISVTDTALNTASGTGDSSVKDTTADSPADLAVTINDGDGYINNSEKAAVSYTVAGVDGDASATVTFSDGVSGHDIVVSGLHDGATSVDLHTLNDGPITASISVTDTALNTASGTGDSSTKDTTADADANLAVAIDDGGDGYINLSERSSVHYTVAGVDADAHATVTFTSDGGGSVTVNSLGNGPQTVDLSTLTDGIITASISATDTALNTANGTGDSSTLDATPPELVGTVVILTDNGSGGTELDLQGNTDAFVIDVADASGTLGSPTADGSGWSDTVASLTSGSHHVVVTATDEALNTTTTNFDLAGIGSTDVTLDLRNFAMAAGTIIDTSQLSSQPNVTVYGSAVTDAIQTGDGNDIIDGGVNGGDQVIAGGGNDQITTHGNGSQVDAGAGNDVVTDDVVAGLYIDQVMGGAGNDTITFVRDGFNDGGDAEFSGRYDTAEGSSNRDYSLEHTASDTWVVTALVGTDGADTVTGADALLFDGGPGIGVNTADLITLLNTATGSVNENSGSGTSVGITAHATGSHVTYALLDDDGHRFAIDGSSGAITAGTTNIDRETDGPTRQVTVKATADDGSFTQHTYTINIGDVNDNAPVFTSGTTASEAENTATTNVVYDANATDADVTAANNTIAFSLSGDDAALFSIDSVSGQVRFLASPDFETPADANHDNNYQVTVHANDGLHNTTQDVTISVTDVNDNAPVVTTAATQSVAENTTFVAALTSTDADTVGTNPASFSITGGDDAAKFQVVTVGGVQQLQFVAAPDFEAHASFAGTNGYQVQVTANDGANTTPELITVNVTDANDNAPVITTGATQSVAENTTFVASLTSTDADTVGTNPATFSITGGSDAAKFQIVTVGGVQQLQFAAAPDFEAHASFAGTNSYQVQVTASDGANATPELITVNVTDVNDNAPVFTSSATPSVAENTTAVVDLTTTDPDTVGANPPAFSITGGADQALFTITGGNHLAFITPHDFETEAHSYAVQVTANDGTNQTIQNITVSLTDVNDNAPLFTSSATPSVAENTTAVVDLTTTDPDTVGTNPPTFTITGGADQALFTITGGNQLAFIAPHDFETEAHSYAVQVTANDGANQTVQNILVTLTDVNDNAPVFTSSATPSVAENTTAVVALATTDADTVGTNPPTFTITGGADQALFTITGGNHLAFIAPHDFETEAHSYAVQVTANDGTNQTVQNIAVALTDTNDNGPVFTSSATPSVAENTTAVVALTTTDPDTVGTNPATFTITGGADQALFTITGGNQLAFIAPHDFETEAHSYAVQVTANDGANQTVQNITVSLTDVNDNAPLFTSSAAPSVAENTTAVVDLTSTDPDTVGTNPATFTITGGADQTLFTITGGNHLAFIAPHDFETEAHSYAVQVTANDGANQTVQNIAVSLTDVNDNAPVITTAATQSVAENTTFVANLTSTDADTVGTNPAIFSITGGNDGALFHIVTVSGVQQLQFVAGPDFEAHASFASSNAYQVQVTANDGTNTAPELITVNVTDVNEAPVVTAGQTFSPNENVQSVGTVVATDQDSIASGFHSIKYTLDANTNDNNLFTIDQTTGALNFVSAAGSDGTDLFGSHGPDYVVDVRVSDASTPALTTHQTVAVHAASIGAITNNGTTGNDTEYGTQSGDTLNGNAGNDTIYGGAGADNIDGGSGNDTLYGGVGIDTINGGAGNDKIYGGAGADALTGGSGADQFIFNTASEGTDTITDFLSANSSLADKIALDKAGFGITTQTSSDLFTNSALSFHDGGLWWNGITGTDTPIELAVVQHITHMSGTDILLV